jgi:DNA-binding transcriptional LysR family regulator
LPETICTNDMDGRVRSLHPIVDPPLFVDYAVIEPAKSALSPAASLFLECIERQYHVVRQVWRQLPDRGLPETSGNQLS